MLLLCIVFISLFEEVYGFNLNYITTESRIGNIVDHCYVKNSRFAFLVSTTGNGGAIYVSSVAINILIEKTLFYSCSVPSGYHGGGIYFKSSTGASFLSEVCGFNCSDISSTRTHGAHFGFIETSPTKINKIVMSSLSKCPAVYNGGDLVLYLSNGIQEVENFNTSHNRCRYYSGIYINQCQTHTSKYCTISHNYVQTGICIEIYYSSNSVNMSRYNIIGNNSPSNAVVWINNGQVFLHNSIFVDNLNTIIHVYSGKMVIIDCNIIHSGYSPGAGQVLINCTTTGYVTFIPIYHYQTRGCDSNFTKTNLNTYSLGLINRIVFKFLLSNLINF